MTMTLEQLTAEVERLKVRVSELEKKNAEGDEIKYERHVSLRDRVERLEHAMDAVVHVAQKIIGK